MILYYSYLNCDIVYMRLENLRIFFNKMHWILFCVVDVCLMTRFYDDITDDYTRF